MTQAKTGDTVRVHYTGKLADGTVFDSSREREPLEFTIGAGQVIPGFEDAVIGMSPQETKTATIPAEEAYGPHYPELVMVVGRESFPEGTRPEIGQQYQVALQGGQTLIVRVTEVAENTVTLDANHPLAGEDLTFDIELVEIV
ncbi:MAG: peptidylprolyl isomerase [Anaerolineae bacterium]